MCELQGACLASSKEREKILSPKPWRAEIDAHYKNKKKLLTYSLIHFAKIMHLPYILNYT